MKIVQRVQETTGLTLYGMVRELGRVGVETSINSLKYLQRSDTRAIRRELLFGFQILTGKGWATVMSWLAEDMDNQVLKNRLRKRKDERAE